MRLLSDMITAVYDRRLDSAMSGFRLILSFWIWLAALWTMHAEGALAGSPQSLQLDPRSAHQAEASLQAEGVWEIRTTGADPFLATSTFEPPPPDFRILSFEYLCLGRIAPFVVFVGAPWGESRKVSAQELSHAEGWQTFSIDLGPALERSKTPPRRLRLDFGGSPGRVVQLKNLRLRAPDARERERAAAREVRAADERALEGELRAYLGRSWPAAVTNVRVGADTVTVEGVVPAGISRDASARTGADRTDRLADGLWLAEAPVWLHLTRERRFEKAARLTPRDSDGRFTIVLERHASVDTKGATRDRLLSRWLVVKVGADGEDPLSAARYADEVEARAVLPVTVPRSKKGLGGYHEGRAGLGDELDRLGIDSITVNLALNRYLTSRPKADSIAFSYCGRTFHANGKAVASLDRTLLAAARRQALVLGILLVPKAADWDAPRLGGIMQHPDCEPAGIFSMANVTSEEGVLHYAALLHFLAERYMRPGLPFGRLHHWIVHNEVDAGWTWTNCGEKPPLLYVDQYHKSMRIAQLIARQFDAGARAYASLTHYWTETASVRYTPSREILRHLLGFSRVEGDFDWGIAYHPYPESLREPKTWLDRRALFRYDTPLITFKNIEVLDAWVRLPENRFLGRTIRSVHLSEQGPNSPDYSEKALAEQAASMAYVWKKLQRLDAIEGFQYHNWIDNRHEGGLRIGLRRFPDDPDEPSGAKPVWHVYRALGTPEEERACAPYLPVTGLKTWDEALYRGAIGGEP